MPTPVATPEAYTLSLHDALPILPEPHGRHGDPGLRVSAAPEARAAGPRGEDRKSTRLNSSHLVISYAVFCLKKKKRPHVTNKVQSKLCRHWNFPLRSTSSSNKRP